MKKRLRKQETKGVKENKRLKELEKREGNRRNGYYKKAKYKETPKIINYPE